MGPGGVFIVDTKAWKEVGIDNGRVLRGDDDVTDELLMLNDLVDVTQADLAEVGLAPGEVRSLVVMAGRGGLNLTHSEPLAQFLGRYGATRPLVEEAITA